MIRCPSCQKQIDPVAFLNACRSYWVDAGTMDVICPFCGASIDAQITAGEIAAGFVYGAGAPHFSAVETTKVEGLRVAKTAKGLEVELGSESWQIPNWAEKS